MSIQVEKREKYLRFEVNSDMVFSTIPKLRSAFEEHKKNGMGNVALVFKNVDYVDSAAIGIIASFAKKTNDGGSTFYICSANEGVLETFKIVDLSNLVTFCSSELEIEEAL